MRLPASDFYPGIRHFVMEKWQQAWDCTTGSKLKDIKPLIGKWKSCSQQERKHEVMLSRLRIGHTYATHRYLLCGEGRPRCPRCGSPLTVLHVLLECRDLENDRARIFGTRVASLRDLLGDDSTLLPNVFQFLNYLRFPIIFSKYS